ncbi:MAG: diacylglycerol kinase family protein [Patescibacteria group bacterium]|nr:diacylglycerol kinase family protein [Patescibacteria group bacterium]HPL01405.1 diacylglycerol kinase family protein [bacterium]
MNYNKFSMPKLVRSFLYASRGIINLLKSEQNARIHLIYAIVVASMAYVLSISRIEAIVLFFAVTLVIATEIINTAIEKLIDIVNPKLCAEIEFIKDAMAGAVLVTAIIALVVTVMIFLPYFNKFIA